MRSLISTLLRVPTRLWKKQELGGLRVGPGTDVYLWRIKGRSGCELSVGDDCYVRTRVVFERAGCALTIGNRTFIGKGLIAVATDVSIGDDVMIAWGVTIVDHDSHSLNFVERSGDTERWLRGEKDWSTVKTGAVRVEDKAWIGFNASILKGVTVGEGAVVAAGSVVTKNVPAWTLIAGNPAKVVRQLA